MDHPFLLKVIELGEYANAPRIPLEADRELGAERSVCRYCGITDLDQGLEARIDVFVFLSYRVGNLVRSLGLMA